ncbi:MAG TPA: hypothetical protein VD996_11105 [Chitinophagaceae bacterium]|nr:hypothetical protein [Chitinophagaceae bacterium]
MSLKAKLLWSFVAGLVLFVICAMLTGGGHGYIEPLAIGFPWFVIATRGLSEVELGFLLFIPAILQMPAYVYLANKNWIKKRRIMWLLIAVVHAIAAAGAFNLLAKEV